MMDIKPDLYLEKNKLSKNWFPFSFSGYKKLEPVGKTGKLSVTATVTYYSYEYLRFAGASITVSISPLTL